MKKFKAISFLFFVIVIGAAITFCMMLMAWPEQTAAVQPADIDITMEDYARQSEAIMQLADVNYKLSGTCGDRVNWYLTEEGTMYVQGTGDMWDYADSALNGINLPVPQWYDFREDITSLVVMPGVTSIGRNAFFECVNLSSCTFPDRLNAIYDEAFRNCTNLTEVVLPDTLSEIGYGAFQNCGNLKSINIPATATKLEGNTFYGCSSLKQLTIPAGLNTIRYGCFSHCVNLTLTFEGSNPSWMRDAREEKLFFDNTRVEICYPAIDESWKDFDPENLGGAIFMTPYETVYDPGSRLMLGDRITFGCYEQDDNPENGPEPIEWYVQSVTEENAFFTTVQYLTVRSDTEAEAPVDWDREKLKTWLNTEFLLSAFSDEEQAMMQPMTYGEIVQYCLMGNAPEDPADETCLVGIYKPTASFYFDDSEEESKMVYTDLLINPVIVFSRNVTFINLTFKY